MAPVGEQGMLLPGGTRAAAAGPYQRGAGEQQSCRADTRMQRSKLPRRAGSQAARRHLRGWVLSKSAPCSRILSL